MKLVLAYSGGLDTSYCAKYLSKDKNFEVHAVSVNTGGFGTEEIKDINDLELIIKKAAVCRIELFDKETPYMVTLNFVYLSGTP